MQNNYGRWLGFLMAQSWLTAGEDPAGRITTEHVRAYVAHLQLGLASVSVENNVAKLIMAAKALFPVTDWKWLRNARARLKHAAVPVRTKADRVVPSWELVQLGYDLMTRAEAMADEPAAAANLYRDGLMIALLAERPFRRRNFLMMEIGQHLTRGRGSWHINFATTDTKTHRAIDRTFPQELVPALERYLACYRPRLIAIVSAMISADHDQAKTRLWISSRGNPLSKGAFRGAINGHTDECFGHPVNPQLFRDCAVTSVAEGDPEHIRMGMHLLRHANFTTTERYYIVARNEVGQKHLQAIIDKRRRASKALVRSRKAAK
ncbi:MAG: hypothetical protein JWR10_2010 [Rubritepida sp.]|nr:hypothetical protein [Rubritepida sp.]